MQNNVLLRLGGILVVAHFTFYIGNKVLKNSREEKIKERLDEVN